MYPQTTTIPLTQGQFAVVDIEDFERLNTYKWQATQSGRTWYARRVIWRSHGKQRYTGMHREIMNAPDGLEVDHINGNGLDNRKCNLRLCTHARNTANQRLSKNNTTGFRGVVRERTCDRWRCGIGGSYVGLFATAEDAARAYDARAREMYGEFAVLNFPNPC